MAISECHVNYVHYVKAIMYMSRATAMATCRHWCVTNAIRMRSEATSSTRNSLDSYAAMDIIQLTPMRSKARKPSRVVEGKAEALGRQGALHPHPEAVHDEAFRQGEFFDSRDLVQVRYEMLRRHQVEGQAVTEVAAAFGVSRQVFYTTQAAFEDRGVCGLLPRQRGPRRAHKCTDEILDFVEQRRVDSAAEQEVTGAIQKRFGVSIHPRSIERALTRRKKKR